MENVNMRFKELRVRLGLTQVEMAQKLGLLQPSWARLENGGVPDPKASTIINICRTFNISADWLLGLSEE